MSINEQLAPLTNEEHLKRTEIVREALTWLNTPFQHGARIKGVGAECGSFIVDVFARFGFAAKYQLPAHAEQWAIHNESALFDELFYIREMKRFCTEITKLPLPADVALFWWGHAYSHGAIVIDWPHQLIHCWPTGAKKSSGVQLVDSAIDPFLRRFSGQHPPRFFNAFLGGSL
jgi:cell wall-associated NlpC family hydrolase